MIKQRNRLILFTIVIITIALLFPVFTRQQSQTSGVFDPDRAWQHVLTQANYGPRTPGSQSHQQVINFIQTQLQQTGWFVEIQETEINGHEVQNIIAKRGSGFPWIILGAHYDSRFFADHDPDLSNQSLPVPGANDGASGVAVLLELARVLPKKSDQQIWLVFFDAEDQGRIEDWDWILGSTAMAKSLNQQPDAVIIIDMIGDSDLQIYREKSSDFTLTDSIWQKAAELGYSEFFINQEKYNVLDDHTPFLEAGISAIDIIDFDYPYWHTIQDTPDKLSKESLAIVGNTLLYWLEEQNAK